MFNRFIEPKIIELLTSGANTIASNARNNARWSSKIPDAISVGTVEKNGGMYEITITVDVSKETGAPMARAFEYGSGNADQINPGLYPIKAVNRPKLVFWWEKGNKWFIGKELPYGHPGVKPRPFLKPAVDKYKRSIKGLVINLLGRGILDGIKTEFKE